VALCVVRALSGLGLAIASPAGYGILGATVRHQPERTIVFAALGLAGPIGAAAGTMIGGAIAAVGV
jgi:MFS family permease